MWVQDHLSRKRKGILLYPGKDGIKTSTIFQTDNHNKMSLINLLAVRYLSLLLMDLWLAVSASVLKWVLKSVSPLIQCKSFIADVNSEALFGEFILWSIKSLKCLVHSFPKSSETIFVWRHNSNLKHLPEPSCKY